MRYLYILLLSSAFLVCAADSGMTGSFTGEWKSDSSGNAGNIRMTLGDNSKCEVSFTLAGEEVKTKMQSCKLANSQVDVAYDFEVQGIIARSKLTGKWDGKALTGRYQTTAVDSGDDVDAGTWNAKRGK